MLSPRTEAALNRTIGAAGRLAEALADLRRDGGLKAVARSMSPSSVTRCTALLETVRDALVVELAELGRPGPAAGPARRPVRRSGRFPRSRPGSARGV